MPNLKSKLTCATLLITTSGCAIIQSNRIEDMTTSYRLEFLQQKTTEELCNAYTNPWIKKETESQIRNILKNREITKCVKDENTRHIPEFKPISKLAWQKVLPKNKTEMTRKWVINLATSLMNESKTYDMKSNMEHYWELNLMGYIVLDYAVLTKASEDVQGNEKFRAKLNEYGLTEDIFNESKNNFSKVIRDLLETNEPKITNNNDSPEQKLIINDKSSVYIKEYQEIKPNNSTPTIDTKAPKKHQTDHITPKQKSHKEVNDDPKARASEDKTKINEENSKPSDTSSMKENIEHQDIKENPQPLDKKEPIKIKSFFDL
jgi:hypothetical protein